MKHDRTWDSNRNLVETNSKTGFEYGFNTGGDSS